jgi:hypothetical protein
MKTERKGVAKLMMTMQKSTKKKRPFQCYCCLMIVALTQVPSNAAAEGYAEALKPEDYLAQAGDLAEKVKADIAKCTDLYEGEMVVGKPGSRGGFVPAKGQLERLFGGVKAKYFLFEGKGEERTVSVVDFSTPELKSEKLFTHRDGGATHGGAPSVSPDGTRLTYLHDNGIVISELKKDAPNRTAFSTSGFDPSWWVHPKTGDEYIIWASTPCDLEKVGTGKNGYSTLTIAEGIKGKTLIRKVKKGTCQPDGPVKTLSDTHAFRGGRSADGKYICTALPGWGLAELKPDAVEDALVKVITMLELSRPDIDPSNDPSMGEIRADANGYTVINLMWATHSTFLTIYNWRHRFRPIGSCLYQPSTGKWFEIVVDSEGPFSKPVHPVPPKSPGQLWVDPQGIPSFPEPTPTAKIVAEWDKTLLAVGEREFAAKVKRAGSEGGKVTINFTSQALNHLLRVVGFLDGGFFYMEIGRAPTFKMRASEMPMLEKKRMAQAFAAERKDKQAMAVAAFFTLANEKWELAKEEQLKR